MKVNVTGIKAVATWNWVNENESSCGICRHVFEQACPSCSLPGDDCPIVWGKCQHCFHIHCIIKWLKAQETELHLQNQQQQQECPMCRQTWEY